MKVDIDTMHALDKDKVHFIKMRNGTSLDFIEAFAEHCHTCGIVALISVGDDVLTIDTREALN